MQTVMLLRVAAVVALGLAMAGVAWPRAAEARDYYQVYNSADSGPGTLRDAVNEANRNGRQTTIVLGKGVTLSSPVEYTGSQPLTIRGPRANRNRTVDGGGGCGILKSSGGADVTLQDVTLVQSVCGGLEAGGEAKDGELAVTLRRVTVRGIGADGVRVMDPEGSPASLRLEVRDSRFLETRGDGISFGERGPGTAGVVVSGSWFSVAANGIAGSEEGAGDLSLTLMHNEFNRNGVHGVRLTEAGAGTAVISLRNDVFKSNGVDGLNVDEEGDGGVTIGASGARASANGGEGVVVQQHGTGEVTLGPGGFDIELGEGDQAIVGPGDDGPSALLIPLP
jgi:hypothetical protein